MLIGTPSGSGMEFRILGPLEAWHDGRRRALGPPKQRALLGVLLLQANHTVSVDQLIEGLWGEAPPATVAAMLQVYVSKLRRVLRCGGDDDAGGPTVVTERPGYRLLVEPEKLDSNRFEQLVEQGRRALADDEPEQAATALREALSLWRGPALADVTSELVGQATTAHLDETRLAAEEDRVEADLRCGRHHRLVSELKELVAVHPLRERLRGQLMLALYRSRRHVEALQVYQDTRRWLVDNFGIEPGAELQRLQRAILAADPVLEWRPPRQQVARVALIALLPPRQLPPDIRTFTGRQEELERLCALLTPPAAAAPAVISAIDGGAGTGKSALAVHAAHRLAEWFPDGQLYVDLHGAVTGLAPRESGEVLALFLRALGVDGTQIPAKAEEAAVLYRSLVAYRHMLILLDNAATVAQVRPLLPSGPGCSVLITSRPVLATLDAAAHLHLDVLPPKAAVDLLARVAGPARVAAEPEAAATLTRLCGWLPLAVRIAGAKLAGRPHWSVARLADRLADERGQLDELRAGDLDVRAAMKVSYERCAREERRAFRLLGMLDAPDFAPSVLAAMLDVPVATAEDLAERLVDARLLEAARQDPSGQTRYRFPELLRLYARERLHDEEPEPARRAALQRAHAT
jgi:DNA-binding SARP family transcriptional activator